jgi:hypothetical protein
MSSRTYRSAVAYGSHVLRAASLRYQMWCGAKRLFNYRLLAYLKSNRTCEGAKMPRVEWALIEDDVQGAQNRRLGLLRGEMPRTLMRAHGNDN